ncbi:MAG TPA: kelch repeat-containing protein [Ferruginibacter sp.]|nr:kelch repeat-containing protein [Ferruginibacter sp.]
MHKIRVFSFVGLLGILLMASSCTKTNSNPSIGNWIRREDLGGANRSEAVAFVVGNSGYVTTGLDFTFFSTPGAQDSLGRYYDLWQYTPDPSTDADKTGNWAGSTFGTETQLDSFPGTPRSSAVAFNIGDTGYIGTGYDGSNALKDFWAYIPSLNKWEQMADFPATARYDAVGFELGGKGYITTGYTGGAYLSDTYQYDPVHDQWKNVASFPGTKCSQAVAFVSNDTTAYVCTGSNNGNTSICNQLFAMEVVPGTNGDSITWTQKRHISNFSTESYDDLYAMVRTNAVAFVMGDFAYLTTGNNGAERADTWEYDIKNDLWYQETSYEGLAREGAVAFTIGNRGFVGTGRNATINTGQFSDFWEWFPTQPYNALD